MIYIEPTSYVLGLVKQLRQQSSMEIDVYFITQNLTQEWNLRFDDVAARVLPKGIIACTCTLRAALVTGHYSVLHLAGWGHPVFLSGLVLARANRLPVVVESDTQLPFEIPVWKRTLKRLIMPILFRMPSGFLPGGTRQAKYLKHYGVPDERIQIAQMTVDVAAIIEYSTRFRDEQKSRWRQAHGMRAEHIVFLFVGRLEPVKNLESLLEAFESVHARCLQARLCIVGDGSLRQKIEAKAIATEWLVFTGRLTGEDLLETFCSADAFVLPSRLESWGLVVNEAMAAGLPVIASNRVGCVDDLVVHGQTGLVFDTENAEGMYSAITSMAEQAEKRGEMGQNARKLITQWTLLEEARRVNDAWSRVL